MRIWQPWSKLPRLPDRIELTHLSGEAQALLVYGLDVADASIAVQQDDRVPLGERRDGFRRFGLGVYAGNGCHLLRKSEYIARHDTERG